MILLSNRCLDPFNTPASKSDVKFLVVDGYMNATDGTCTISLTRTIPLESKRTPPLETLAVVWLEDENGSIVTLRELPAGTGNYSASNISFNAGARIKLRVRTRLRVEFESDFVTVLDTPPIDQVTWGAERIGVPINISTHDPTDMTRYYKWSFVETWSYKSAYYSALALNGLTPILASEETYQCWKSANSTDILIGSASGLDKEINRISNQTLVTIPWESPKIQERYSMLIEQRAIDQRAYEYFQQLQKNTENLGTLFDPLPSQPVGNIRCITNASQQVLGYFTASSVQKTRIFFNSTDLDRPQGTRSLTGYEGCSIDTIIFTSQYSTLFPIGGSLPHMPRIGALEFCIDCRMLGGTNKRPDFWVY